MISVMSLDILDLKIVKCLTDDARCTYKSMAEEAGVSEATIKNRIDRLMDEGIIKKFTVIMDYHKLGRAIKAFIGLKVQPAKLQEIVEVIQKNSDVHVLYRTSGDVDLLIEVIFEQMEDLNEFLEKELALDGILGTVVTIVIGPYKRCPWTGL
jgi:Lrp/AsnC family transcriptional regulator for asnA, asnC and gidA